MAGLCVRSAILIILSFLSTLQYALPAASPTADVEEVATGLEAPWSISFASDGTIYVTERPGRIRVIKQGVLQPSPIATIGVRSFAGNESGLLGMALDPNFNANKLVYIYYTYTNSPTDQVLNRISRLTETNGLIGNEQVLLDNIKGANMHDGGRLKIGPDGKLYATTGDADDGSLAQDLSSPNGKILRLNLDGSIPTDNPFFGSFAYSLGHRNPQGIAWDTAGHMLASEHGPSGIFFSPCCNDEINLIQPRNNYGWPIVYGISGNPSFTDPILSTGSDTWAPSGMTFYSASNIPEWTGKFLVATLRGRHLRVLDLSFSPTVQVVSSTAFFSDTYGRLRDVVQGHDGYVYVATSNQDGRGTPNPGDDKILRIIGTGGQSPGTGGFPLYLVYVAAVVAAVGSCFLAFRWFRNKRGLGSSIQKLQFCTCSSTSCQMFAGAFQEVEECPFVATSRSVKFLPFTRFV